MQSCREKRRSIPAGQVASSDRPGLGKIEPPGAALLEASAHIPRRGPPSSAPTNDRLVVRGVRSHVQTG
jgi:hypothetical protein